MRFCKTIWGVIFLGMVLEVSVYAAPAKKYAHKPVSAKKAAQHIEMGTHQMPGTNAQFGVVYTVDNNETPINFAITSAEYMVSPAWIGTNGDSVAKPDEKIVAVHYRIKNPNKTDFYCDAGFPVQIVDSQNNTVEAIDNCGRRLNETGAYGQMLKPGQGVDDLVDFFVIPAKGAPSKLIVNYAPIGTQDKVMRYPIGTGKNIIKPLQAPYADPSDPSGATALTALTGELSKLCISGEYNFQIDSFAYAPGPFGTHTADDGKRFLVVTMSATNLLPYKLYYYGNSVIEAKTADDSMTSYNWLKSQSDGDFDTRFQDPGETFPMRMIVEVPKDADVKTFTIQIQDGSRPVVYDLSDVK